MIYFYIIFICYSNISYIYYYMIYTSVYTMCITLRYTHITYQYTIYMTYHIGVTIYIMIMIYDRGYKYVNIYFI